MVAWSRIPRALAAGVLAASSAASQDAASLPGEPFELLDERLQKSLAALDPRVEGGTSEVRAGAALAQLEKLARFFETPGADPESQLAGVFSDDFACTD